MPEVILLVNFEDWGTTPFLDEQGRELCECYLMRGVCDCAGPLNAQCRTSGALIGGQPGGTTADQAQACTPDPTASTA